EACRFPPPWTVEETAPCRLPSGRGKKRCTTGTFSFLFCTSQRRLPSLCLFRLCLFDALVRDRQLKHGRLLAFVEKRQQDDLAIRKFQRVMVSGCDGFVYLTEDGSPVLDRALTPGPRAQTPDFFRERQLGTG